MVCRTTGTLAKSCSSEEFPIGILRQDNQYPQIFLASLILLPGKPDVVIRKRNPACDFSHHRAPNHRSHGSLASAKIKNIIQSKNDTTMLITVSIAIKLTALDPDQSNTCRPCFKIAG
jgi:hypothetical protein